MRVLETLEHATSDREQQGDAGHDHPAAPGARRVRRIAEAGGAQHEGGCYRDAVGVGRVDPSRAPEPVVIERAQVEVREDEAEEEHDRRAGRQAEADPVDAVGQLGRLDVGLSLVANRFLHG